MKQTTYKPLSGYKETQRGITMIKETFEKKLLETLSLTKVSCPRFLVTQTGLQDDLAGTQEPVRFKTKCSELSVEIVHSLAKWKRFTLGRFDFAPGAGILTDMFAVRKDEIPDAFHSVYVDQWDWEQVITPTQRSLTYLQQVVRSIYEAMRETEQQVCKHHAQLKPRLARDITFVHTEELEKLYPDLIPKEREDSITRKYGAVFIIGIGHNLSSGGPHDLRAADYDDWSTPTSKDRKGLNGDIVVWDDIGQRAFEISSMGIRVDAESLERQLEIMKLGHYRAWPFHQAILKDALPLSIGGGIGQSRLCMFLLHKRHIGEVQPSVWPEETIREMEAKQILLL